MDFNADEFMNDQMDAPLETEIRLVPVGEYQATIDDFTSEAIENFEFEYKRGPNAGQPGSMKKLSLPFVINDDTAKQAVGRDVNDKLVVTKQLILDVDKSTGKLDFGVNKNVELGRIRDAVGQNQAGPWSISSLRGAGPVMVKVEHIDFKRKDGSSGKRVEVTRVVKIT